jgi:hypothetical protein
VDYITNTPGYNFRKGQPVVTGIDPKPASFGAAAAWIEHGDRCVVGEQRLRGEHMLCEPGLQRLQPPDGASNPIGERRAIQLDTVPGEDLLCR